MTGTILDEADLSGALMVNATFNSYTAPAKKAAAGQGAQLHRAVAKEVHRRRLIFETFSSCLLSSDVSSRV